MMVLYQLVVPLFGPKDAWERQTMLPLLLRSVERSNVSLTIIGNAGPRSRHLGPSVRHRFVTWATHVEKFEALAERDLGMTMHDEKLSGISGHKPYLPLLYPEEFTAEWIGWIDLDLLVSFELYDLVRDADAKNVDFIAPARHSQYEIASKNVHWSYGPLMAFRRSSYDGVIADALLEYLRNPENPVPGLAFDEWGFRYWGGAGFNNSFSGLLDGLIAHKLLTPYDLPPDFPTVTEPPFFDGCCRADRRHVDIVCQPKPAFNAGKRPSCGYCKYNDSSGIAHLSALDGHPISFATSSTPKLIGAPRRRGTRPIITPPPSLPRPPPSLPPPPVSGSFPPPLGMTRWLRRVGTSLLPSLFFFCTPYLCRFAIHKLHSAAGRVGGETTCRTPNHLPVVPGRGSGTSR